MFGKFASCSPSDPLQSSHRLLPLTWVIETRSHVGFLTQMSSPLQWDCTELVNWLMRQGVSATVIENVLQLQISGLLFNEFSKEEYEEIGLVRHVDQMKIMVAWEKQIKPALSLSSRDAVMLTESLKELKETMQIRFQELEDLIFTKLHDRTDPVQVSSSSSNIPEAEKAGGIPSIEEEVPQPPSVIEEALPEDIVKALMDAYLLETTETILKEIPGEVELNGRAICFYHTLEMTEMVYQEHWLCVGGGEGVYIRGDILAVDAGGESVQVPDWRVYAAMVRLTQSPVELNESDRTVRCVVVFILVIEDTDEADSSKVLDAVTPPLHQLRLWWKPDGVEEEDAYLLLDEFIIVQPPTSTMIEAL